MKELGFDFDSLIFPPERLAHESDTCSREVDTFVNGTHKAMKDLNLTLNIINSWDSGSKDLNLKETLNYLFENLFEYESNFELLKDNCFDQFTDTVNEIKVFFTSHMEEVKEDTDRLLNIPSLLMKKQRIFTRKRQHFMDMLTNISIEVI